MISDDLDVVHGGKVFPSLSDHKLDHNIAAWLLDCYRFTLPLTTVVWKLSRLSNDLEAVAIRSLTPFNRDLLDSSGHETYFIDNLRLLKLDCELLGEHARHQPI